MSCSTVDELEDQRRELESRRTMLEERFKLRVATAQEFGVVHTRRLDRVLQAFVSQCDAARTRNQHVLEELRGYETSFDERVLENSWTNRKRLNLETERFLSVVEGLYPSWQERQLERKASQIRRLEQERCATEKRRRAARDRFVQEQGVNAVVEERQRLLDAARAQERIEAALRHSQRENFLERARKQGNTATTPRQGEGRGRQVQQAAVVAQKTNPSNEGRSNSALRRELTGVESEDRAGPDVQKPARDDTAASMGEKVDPAHSWVLASLSPDSEGASGSIGQDRRTKAAAWDERGKKGAGVRNESVPSENFGRLIGTTAPEAGGEACGNTNGFAPGTSAIRLEQGKWQDPDDSGVLRPAVSMSKITAGSPPHMYPAPLVETRPVLAQIPSCPQIVDKGDMNSSPQSCPSIESLGETLSPLAGASLQPGGKIQSESGAASVSTSESSSSSLPGTVPSSATTRTRSDEARSSNPGDVESASSGEDARLATNEDGDAGSGGARRNGEGEDKKSEEIAHGDLAVLCPSILHASRVVVVLISGIERVAQRMLIDKAGNGDRRSTSSVIVDAYRTAYGTSPSSRRAAIASAAAETSSSPSIALSGLRRPLEEFDLGVLCGAVLDLVGSRAKDILPNEVVSGPVTAATVRSQHCRRGPTERVNLFDGFISHIRHLGASGDVEPHAVAAIFEPCFVVPDKRVEVEHGFLRGECQRLARKVTAILETAADPDGPPPDQTPRSLEHAGCVSLQGLVGATSHVRRDRSVHERIDETEAESAVEVIEAEKVESGTRYRAVGGSPPQPVAHDSAPSGIGRDAATAPDGQSFPAEDRIGARADEGGVSPIVQERSSPVENPLGDDPGKTRSAVAETTGGGGENTINALGTKAWSRTILGTGIERTMRSAADKPGGASGARQAGQEQSRKKSEPIGGSGVLIGNGGTIGKKKSALDLSVVAGLGVASSSQSKNLEEFEVRMGSKMACKTCVGTWEGREFARIRRHARGLRTLR